MKTKSTLEPSLIVKVVTQKMFPFILMYGFYITLHGSSSPGGGFQGGVVIGAAFILFAIGFDPKKSRRRTPEIMVNIMRSAGVLIFVGIGLAGVLLGYAFLANRVAGFPPQGRMGSLLSGGTLLGINIGIAITVASTVVTLFYSFLECKTKDEYKKRLNSERGNLS
jgi:multicomponent Na+:H+ antiporter subunit B